MHGRFKEICRQEKDAYLRLFQISHWRQNHCDVFSLRRIFTAGSTNALESVLYAPDRSLIVAGDRVDNPQVILSGKAEISSGVSDKAKSTGIEAVTQSFSPAFE
jgi:hypothetical protein